MLTSLPIELQLKLSEYVALPYCVRISDEEKWLHLKPDFIIDEVEPVKPEPDQLKVLWSYWNHRRYGGQYLVPAIENGLRYIPLLKQYISPVTSSEEVRIATALVQTNDEEVLSEVLEPMILAFIENGEGVIRLLTQAFLARNELAVTRILGLIRQEDDDDSVFYDFIMSLKSYLYQRLTPITGDELEFVLKIAEEYKEDDDVNEGYSIRVELVVMAYDTIHHELLTRAIEALPKVHPGNLAGLMDPAMYRLQNLNYFRFISKLPYFPEHQGRISLLSLLEKGEVFSDRFYQQFFSLFYKPNMKLAHCLASCRCITEDRAEPSHLKRYQRFLTQLIAHEGSDAVRVEFVEALRPEWHGASLVTLMKMF
jgi:hypothetical protein